MDKCYVVYEHYDDIVNILKVFGEYEDAVRFKFNLNLEEIEKYYINSKQLLNGVAKFDMELLPELGLSKSCTIGDFWKKVLELDFDKIEFFVKCYLPSCRLIKEVNFV